MRFTELPDLSPSNQRAASSQINQTGTTRGFEPSTVPKKAITGIAKTISLSKLDPKFSPQAGVVSNTVYMMSRPQR